MANDTLPSTAQTPAQALIAQAEKLSKRKRHLAAIRVYKQALAVLPEDGPSNLLADTWRSLSFEHWYHKRGLTSARAKERHAQEMLNGYEQAITVWEQLPDQDILGGNLTNLSAMYYQLGQFDIALARSQRGLAIEKIRQTERDSESVHAWTHVIGAHTQLGQLDEAEAVIKDATTTFATDNHSLSYLYDLQAVIHDKRAAALRKLSRELRPEEACHL